jgi:hypothetical protein
MTIAARPADFQSNIAAYRRPVAVKAAPRPAILRRVFDVVFETRQRHAERVVEAYLARTGYRFTDSIERELNEHMFKSGWNMRL